VIDKTPGLDEPREFEAERKKLGSGAHGTPARRQHSCQELEALGKKVLLAWAARAPETQATSSQAPTPNLSKPQMDAKGAGQPGTTAASVTAGATNGGASAVARGAEQSNDRAALLIIRRMAGIEGDSTAAAAHGWPAVPSQTRSERTSAVMQALDWRRSRRSLRG